jgi:carboxypeptidase Q
MSRLPLILLASACLAGPVAAQSVDRVAVNGIINQGLNQSQIMQTAAHLTDRIGSRMTNSPGMRQAEAWTQEQFRSYGLSNVRAEGFEFARSSSAPSRSPGRPAPTASSRPASSSPR